MKRANGKAHLIRVLIGLGACLGRVPAASAHLPQPQGRLIDLVAESTAIVIATVERSQAGTGGTETTARVERWVVGGEQERAIAFRGGPRVAAGTRYVFFLHRDGERLVCLQPSATVFAARPGDDSAYVEAIAAIGKARGLDAEAGTAMLQGAMIAAMAAPAPALRYHAVLELAALARHGLAAPQRRSLEAFAASSGTDPALHSVLAAVLAAAPQKP